ncbi:glutathione transferase GstA [Sorangium sp. So ce1128]
MFRLYYAPHACSIAVHIALREAGLPFELDQVDFMQGKTTQSGKNLTDISPKGQVPALLLPDGNVLTEGAVIMQYIADQKPEVELAPPAGTFERTRLQEWLNFAATELHKGLSPLFSPLISDEYRQAVKEKVGARFAFLASNLEGKRYLFGDRFTVVDGYIFYSIRTWRRLTKADLPRGLDEYYARIAERPHVKAALEAEGLTA